MSRRSPARRSALVGAAAALVVVGALSACTPRAGSAAYVGDDRITVEQVQSDSTEVIEAALRVNPSPLESGEVNRRQVNRIVTDRLIVEAAERRNVTVTDAEVDALLADAIGSTPRETFEDQLAASQLVPPSSLDEFARIFALTTKLGEQLAPNGDETTRTNALVKVLGDLGGELGVGVSPRFGVWDGSDLSVALPPNDLSVRSDSVQVRSGTVESD